MYSAWYQRTYHELQQAGLWLRGGEINTLPAEEFEKRPFRALFMRLSTYFDTGYSFTHQILYQIAARTEGVFPDLAFLPPRADLPIFERDKIPWLLGAQSKRGASEFDFIGISNAIVQELINLPSMLKASGIPLSKQERMKRDDLPLLILGGANALYSSCVWLDEPAVDGVFVGESDAAIRKMLEICRDGKAAGRSKVEILKLLEEIPGFFQPENPRSTRKSFVWDLNKAEALERAPIYYLEEPLGSSHLQISEGCPCFCSFCAESWDRKPYRERSREVLKETALRLKASMGLDSIDIYSFNFNMHSGLYGVLWDLAPHFRQIGLKSQRFDLLAHDEVMIKIQHVLEKANLTCGLEGISPRLRRYLQKNLNTDDLHASLMGILKSKARELKVFLIATGHEEEQDFIALEDLLEHFKDIRRKSGSGARIMFSMTPLVRFPWTPLEFEDAFSMAHYDTIIRKAAQRVRNAGFEFREAADLPEYWVSQVLVRAAHPGVVRALRRATSATGFLYYREITEGFRSAFERELIQEGLDPVALLRGHSLEESASKPWTAIETTVKRDYLWYRCQLSREFKEEDYCLGRSWVKAKCHHCGGCPTRFHVRAIVMSEQKRDYTIEQFIERRKQAQQAERKALLRVRVGEKGRGVPRKMVGVAVARALMLSEPALVPAYRGYNGARWADEDRPVWVIGQDQLTTTWNGEALKVLEEVFKDPARLAKVNAEMVGWAELLGFGNEDWRPSRLHVRGNVEIRIEDFLKEKGLKHTLRKQTDGSYLYELVPQSVKKGVVSSIVKRKNGTTVECEIQLGPKFEFREFMERTVGKKRGLTTFFESDPVR